MLHKCPCLASGCRYESGLDAVLHSCFLFYPLLSFWAPVSNKHTKKKCSFMQCSYLWSKSTAVAFQWRLLWASPVWKGQAAVAYNIYLSSSQLFGKNMFENSLQIQNTTTFFCVKPDHCKITNESQEIQMVYKKRCPSAASKGKLYQYLNFCTQAHNTSADGNVRVSSEPTSRRL